MVYILCWFMRYAKKVKQIRNNNIIASAIRIYAQISHFKSNYWETKKGVYNLTKRCFTLTWTKFRATCNWPTIKKKLIIKYKIKYTSPTRNVSMFFIYLSFLKYVETPFLYWHKRHSYRMYIYMYIESASHHWWMHILYVSLTCLFIAHS